MDIEIKPTATAQPCILCDKDAAFRERAIDLDEHVRLRRGCQKDCELFDYYTKYGINRLVEPDPVELDFLITVINMLISKLEKDGLKPDDLDRLEVWSKRLSVILNMEEVKMEAANSAIDQVERIINEYGR